MDAPPALETWHNAVQEQILTQAEMNRSFELLVERPQTSSALYLGPTDGTIESFPPLAVWGPVASAAGDDSSTAVASSSLGSSAVAAWGSWSAPIQEVMLATDPLVVGNLPDAPLATRITANRMTAAHEAHQSDVDPALAAFFESVAAGERSLVSLDPGNDRIVELVGTISDKTERVIIYVPGSDADFAAFAKGEIQGIVEDLVADDRTGSTVGFVIKDGAWANWDQAGDRGNYDPQFADATGKRIASVSESLLADPRLAGAERIAIGHSWGISALSSAEVHGAHFDSVFSLAGGWLDGDWEPNPDTDYFHFQYGTDAINYFEPTGNFPRENEAFDCRIMAPETISVLGRHLQNEPFNHGRISIGGELNRPVTNAIFAELTGHLPTLSSAGGGR